VSFEVGIISFHLSSTTYCVEVRWCLWPAMQLLTISGILVSHTVHEQHGGGLTVSFKYLKAALYYW